MSIVRFPPDQRKYLRYKGNSRSLIRCAETQQDNEGNTLECTYRDVREDNHKSRKTLHVCTFAKTPCTNTITNYINPEIKKKSQDCPDDYTIDNLITKIAILTGQKNLPLTFCESNVFYDLVIFSMACGANLIERE